MTPKFHALRIAEVRRETADAISVCFDVPAALRKEYRFSPGQHLTLKATLDGEELRRSYSICAGVDDGLLRIAIKRVTNGRFSNWALTQLAADQFIEVLTPDGRFTAPLNAAHRKHYVAFAAGSGITPVLSLIKSILAREPRSRFTLIYGNRRQTDVLFMEELEELKDRYLTRFSLYHVFSREQQDVDLFNGRIDADKVQAFNQTLVPVRDIDAVFICGPGAMIDDAESALRECGLAPERIHVERFGTADASKSAHHVEPGDAPHALVTVIIDGIRRKFDYRNRDEPLLDAAIAAGIDLPYSCKGGMCCTCRSKLLEGRVRMERNYSLEQPDLDAGYILTCQAHPLSEAITLSFDDR